MEIAREKSYSIGDLNDTGLSKITDICIRIQEKTTNNPV